MEKLYLLFSRGSLTTVAVSPDYFEVAVDNGLFGPDSGRDIHRQLLYKEYNGKNVYPPFVEFPVVFRQFDGKRLCDLLDMRFDGRCFLISDKMKTLLETNSFSGWNSFPVILYDKKGNLIQGYHGFTVTGRGGAWRCLVSPEKDFAYCTVSERGWDMNQWDGNDIFRIGDNFIALTEKVVTILKKNKIDGASIEPIDRYMTIIAK